jgi:glucose-6-phosphate isomerase
MDEIKDDKRYSSARSSQYWQQLQSLAKQPWSLAALFAQDDERATRFSRQAGALYMDFSKQRIDQTVLSNLLSLADSCELDARID